MDTERIHRWIPVLLIAIFFITAVSMLAGTPLRTAIDPDAVLTDIILFGLTILIFIAIRKYKNILLETGFALLIYATGIHIVEEFTREFTIFGLLCYTILLGGGVLLICAGVLRIRERIDHDLEQLKVQEQRLRTGAEEMARLNASLSQANQKLRLLSQITRHDIGNRLLVASGYAAIGKNMRDCTEKDAALGKIEESLKSISAIISFTAMYEEIGLAAPEWQEINHLVGAASGLLGKQGVAIVNDTEPGLAVYADTMLGKVFYNLIENALQYGGDGIKQVRFFTHREKGSLLVVCEDDGAGIPAEDKQKIFFKGVGKNTGLGLFLSAEILAITGITIRERGITGSGARFEIHVPEGKYRQMR